MSIPNLENFITKFHLNQNLANIKNITKEAYTIKTINIFGTDSEIYSKNTNLYNFQTFNSSILVNFKQDSL